MYQQIDQFLDHYFPLLEGCILFGSYKDDCNHANDIDLLLISRKFSFSATESFVFNGLPFNTIKINSTEVLNIVAKQFRQGNFLSHAFKTGIVIRDETKELSHIRKFVLSNVPDSAADVIRFDLSEIRFKIKDYMEPIIKAKTLTNKNFLQASRIVSLFIDFFLLDKGIYLKTEKSKNKIFFQEFPIQTIEVSKLIDALRSKNFIEFKTNVDWLNSKYSVFIDKKYSNNFILDDYTQDWVFCFVESTFKFGEITEIIIKIKKYQPNAEFYVYQADDENQEKKGCYIVFDNSRCLIDFKKKEWIEFLQILFKDHSFTFPYNNIFCCAEIKFMGSSNEHIVNQFMLSLTNAIHCNKYLSKEEFIFKIVTSFFNSSAFTYNDLYNFYLIKMDGKAKTSNFLNSNIQKIGDKFIKANQSIEETLLQSFTLSQAELMDFSALEKINPIVHLQIIDRMLSIFLSKDYEKLYYIYAITLKFNEKIS
ncbi:hypothetical protein MKJ01_05860 [Chryseobacterium sp. SSA4.19]|uniref:hypothetical protein n=1 Tax=Chryseobacterium sp. SSA4.19 TaxID=2919915 RepID=UPI001F4D6A33|nr:hypothetical protein [Chryseobacterium sp. SSA4.19]MCJ8153285.1 hypothetical protein [Chryseobacterium sp. SSA4.19]